MRKISIIGSGQAGLICAISLKRRGYEVALYSDRTAAQWLNESRPTGNAYLFDEALDIERSIGIDHWSATMYAGGGGYFHIATPEGGWMTVKAPTARPGGAVDQRMKFHRWMHDFEAMGGELVIESVSADRAEAIAATSSLTLLAAGKAELSRLVPRDPERSVFEKPARQLALVMLRNVRDWAAEIGYTPVKFTALGPDIGEIFWVPFTHKTAGACWSVVVEAVPGGPLDLFRDVGSGEELVEVLRAAVARFAPQDLEQVGDMDYLSEDPFAWLTGAFPPTVRKACGRLPNGALLMPIGDAAITFDPIGGQGGNNASHHARHVADAIVARAGAPFDAAWMDRVFETYWERRGGYAYRFNNMMLQPTPGFLALMAAAAEDDHVGDRLIGAYSGSPQGFFPWIEDAAATMRQVEQLSQSAA